ncbi:hypothetical protein BV898_00158 [Hypsibius exemplaris]|uniref:Uncharacterized protein n=1 Tax=Hypsibius exemplaris TaxID=2072580 RepID=A0A1W0XF52_HYPEX|nr:hypothetical protein BV898_00158 [Hypsibius exemplaris]
MANRVRKAIGGLFHHQTVKHQLKLLQKSRQNYHKIQGNFNVINDFFSLTAWSVCCAILTIVAFIATLLRRWVKEDTETNDEYMEQYIEAQSSLIQVIGVMFTYTILIYQTKDGKGDMMKLIPLEQRCSNGIIFIMSPFLAEEPITSDNE